LPFSGSVVSNTQSFHHATAPKEATKLTCLPCMQYYGIYIATHTHCTYAKNNNNK
jgi:hypothetical protein